jgi:hypothetical protein
MDYFANAKVNLEAPGRGHFPITPSDTVDMLVRPRAIYCLTAGNAVLQDANGVNVTYALTAGQVLSFGPTRVLATGTTAALVGWY